MKFNGIDPTTLHRGISIAKEIPPGTVTSKLETLSGSDGEIIVGRTIKQGEYIVRINIAGRYREEAWQIRKLLAAWARGTDAKTCELIPTRWPTVHYDAALKEISPPEFTFGFAVIDVIFAVPRPIAVENILRTATSGETEGETLLYTSYGENFVTSDGYQMAVSPVETMRATSPSVGITKIVIGGTSHARPKITLFCRATENPRISVGTKVLFGFTGAVTNNERIEISTNPPNVRIMSSVGDDAGKWLDANDRIDYTRTDFQRLAEAFAPGERTVMCYQASKVNVEWRDEWL
jgi:hypothetical protein